MPNLPSPLVEPTLRPDLPIYPLQVQLLRVTATTVPGPAGVAQTAGSSVLGPTLYVAFTQQLRTDGLLPRDREPCLVDDVNGRGIEPGYYNGRLSGSHQSLPVYEVAGPSLTSLSVPTFAFAKCLSETPTLGRYDAKLQEEQFDGTLTSTGIDVWLREANDKDRLISGEIYFCKKTNPSGTLVAGRHVYTCVDFNLTVRNQGGGTTFDKIYRLLLGPDNNWDITQTESRRILAKRILEVYEGASLKMDYVKKLVFKSSADPLEDDFDLTAGAAGSGDINEVALAGATQTLYLLECCQSGQLKARQFSIRRGSIKVIGSRVNDPGCASS